MKIQLHLKDPDGVGNAIDEAARAEAARAKAAVPDLDIEDAAEDAARDNIVEAIKRWVAYQEYVTIEIDTVAGTAVVVPV